MRLHGSPEEEIRALLEVQDGRRRYARSVEVDREVDEGDRVQAGGRSWRVLARPGHSPTDTIFVDEDDASALVADHLLAHVSSNALVDRAPGAPADPRLRRSSLATYLDSLTRTAELDLRLLHPGHGEPITAVRELIEERLGLVEGRKEQVAAALRDAPRTAHAVALALFPKLPANQKYLALSEALGILDLLVADGRAVELDRGEHLEYELADVRAAHS
jgi:glyoxylase-like metal-dependent hydrolase (beta-lactamase superfamily II)